MEKLLDVVEAADFLDLSPKTIYTYICKRKIPFLKINSSVRFRQSDLESWIEKHLVKPLAD